MKIHGPPKRILRRGVSPRTSSDFFPPDVFVFLLFLLFDQLFRRRTFKLVSRLTRSGENTRQPQQQQQRHDEEYIIIIISGACRQIHPNASDADCSVGRRHNNIIYMYILCIAAVDKYYCANGRAMIPRCRLCTTRAIHTKPYTTHTTMYTCCCARVLFCTCTLVHYNILQYNRYTRAL